MGQALEQLPQCCASFEVSTHDAPQVVNEPQDEAHAPWLHTAPVPHALEHDPQWLGSVVVSTSQPLAGFPSQSAQPGAQAPIAQAPALQLGVACGIEQGMHDVLEHPNPGSFAETQCPPQTLSPDEQPPSPPASRPWEGPSALASGDRASPASSDAPPSASAGAPSSIDASLVA